jgi:hypothetical protein
MNPHHKIARILLWQTYHAHNVRVSACVHQTHIHSNAHTRDAVQEYKEKYASTRWHDLGGHACRVPF